MAFVPVDFVARLAALVSVLATDTTVELAIVDDGSGPVANLRIGYGIAGMRRTNRGGIDSRTRERWRV